ncbi:MAG: 50S ribosomal protein L29 [Candidatus Omnitrophica bacterium]|nr:50S ribosomal protein L29 [Candidatus Omnitrophota bacterium]
MSVLKAKDLRNLSVSELDEKKKAVEKELFELRQKKVTGQLDKPHRFKLLRHEIARLNTVRQEKAKKNV